MPSEPRLRSSETTSKVPPRRWPWDVLLLVFKEADPSTLAVLGRVSMDFLASTAPLLYRDVELSSLESLELLFCEREQEEEKNSSAISRINPYLSLDQIRTLFLNFTDVELTSEPKMSPSRIPYSPLLLDRVQISYGHLHGYTLIQVLFDSLFDHLNPLQCAYHLIGRPHTFTPWVCLGSPSSARWTRIQDVEFSGGILSEPFGPGYRLPRCPARSLLQRRTIRLHVASLLSSSGPTVNKFMRRLGFDKSYLGVDTLQDGSLILVVGSEEEKKEVEAGIQEVEPEWRSRFAVEMEV